MPSAHHVRDRLDPQMPNAVNTAGASQRRLTDRAVPILLALAAALAWLYIVRAPSAMNGGLLGFIIPWTIMMIAMMLPSAAPFVMLYSRGAKPNQTAGLVLGYVLVWLAAGVPAYYAMKLLPMRVGPIALAADGLYQLTPLKSACLRSCRSPADFLMQKWRSSPLRIGIEHGAWCFGCCWALMVVLVLVGSMGLLWVVGLTAVVALEKLTRHGLVWARVTGAAFLIIAIVLEVTQWSGASMGTS